MSMPAYTCPLDSELATLLFGNHASLMISQDCRNFRCYSFDTGYVYGLLDTRINDIFIPCQVTRPLRQNSLPVTGN